MAAHDTNKWIGLSEESDTPTARNIAGPRLRAAPDLGAVPGLEFFLQTNSSTRFFNSDSANIFFSSLFSRSSSFSRRDQTTFIEPVYVLV